MNRAKVELDPNMFFDYPREDIGLNQQRSRYGLGIIHKVTADSRPIYAGRISYKEAEERIKNVYDVYHGRLKELIARTIDKFGFCLVLDCHSMPSKICSIISESPRIDYCLGNLFEQSCPNKISFLWKMNWQNASITLPRTARIPGLISLLTTASRASRRIPCNLKSTG